MQINLPKASVGLGTSGIGDNFARARLMMAQKAGYVQSTPSPYSQPGTALKQYQSAAPVLSAVAKAQGQKGIPGLLREGITGRPPMAGVPGQNGSLVNTPAPTYQSTVAQHAVGNPFASLGQPQMAINWFNQGGAGRPTPQPGPVNPGGVVGPVPGNLVNAKGGGQKPPHKAPENIAANPANGGSLVPGNGGYIAPRPVPGVTEGGSPGVVVRPAPPAPPVWNPGGSGAISYPPGTIANNSPVVDPRVGLLAMLLGRL